MFSLRVCVLVVLSTLLCTASASRYFPNDAVWFQDVTNAALDSESQQIIDWLVNNGGWGEFSFVFVGSDTYWSLKTHVNKSSLEELASLLLINIYSWITYVYFKLQEATVNFK